MTLPPNRCSQSTTSCEKPLLPPSHVVRKTAFVVHQFHRSIPQRLDDVPCVSRTIRPGWRWRPFGSASSLGRRRPVLLEGTVVLEKDDGVTVERRNAHESQRDLPRDGVLVDRRRITRKGVPRRRSQKKLNGLSTEPKRVNPGRRVSIFTPRGESSSWLQLKRDRDVGATVCAGDSAGGTCIAARGRLIGYFQHFVRADGWLPVTSAWDFGLLCLARSIGDGLETVGALVEGPRTGRRPEKKVVTGAVVPLLCFEGCAWGSEQKKVG